MGEFRIPEGHRASLAVLFSLNDRKAKELLEVLHNSPKGISAGELSERISEEGKFSTADSREIVKVLSSLYIVKGKERLSTKELVEGICEAALATEDERLKPKDGDWDKFKEFFEGILSEDDNIGITFKAKGLIAENEKYYIDSNIYTDIRPIFGLMDNDKVNTAVIIHNLKIEYLTGDRHDEIQVALDSQDIDRLKKQLLRAVEKEEAIKSQLKNTLDFITPSAQ